MVELLPLQPQYRWGYKDKDISLLVDENGYIHCDNGPAVIWQNPDGTESFEWWIRGKRYPSFEKWINSGYVSDEQITFLKLKYK